MNREIFLSFIYDLFLSPTPSVNVGLFRIYLGFINLYNILRYILPKSDLLIGKDGLCPHELFQERMSHKNCTIWHLGLEPDLCKNIIIFGSIISTLFLCLGLFTPISAIASYILIYSFQYRQGFAMTSGDVVNRLLLFWTIFMFSGSALSVDCAIHDLDMVNGTVPRFAITIVQVLLFQIYCRSVIAKIYNPEWHNGKAIHKAFSLQTVMNHGVPDIFAGTMLKRKWLGILTLILEMLLVPGLIFLPEVFVPIGVLFHIILAYTFCIEFFSLTMIAPYILFIPPEYIFSVLKILKISV